jgi:carbonic anhydrase
VRRTVFTVFLLIGVLIPAPRAQWKTHWTYEGLAGAAHWSELDPAYAACNSGKEQSPIDIRGAEKANLPVLRFEYKSSPLKYLINNGYTIRVNYHDASETGNFLIVGDQRFQLTQFHFHHPSEEYVDGKAYEMEVHLMHQAADGKVAGVVVLLNAGEANEMVQTLWQHMPRTESKEEEIPGVEINPAHLLPADTTAYYQYTGSLTAPPCTEGVSWFVLKNPVSLSPEQIRAFAELYPHDVRPLQPLNGRTIKESN